MTTTGTRIGPPGPTIGSRPTQPAPEPEAEKLGKKAKGKGKDKGDGKGKGKAVRLIGVLIVVAAVAAYWFLMGPGAGASDDAAPVTGAEAEYELGEVLVVEPISINLEGGHYLRLGLGLQLTAHGGHSATPVSSAQALDAAIALFSGRSTEELADLKTRDALKAALTETLKELYDEQVVGVYYTDFVTQ